MNFYAYKINGTLKPATDADKQKVDKIAVGEPVRIKYTRIRNPRLHGKYFAFIGKVWDNLPEKYENYWPTKRSFRKAMEMYAGHFEETVTLKGERRLEAKSIAYDKLDDVAFGELFTGVKNVIGKHILPDMDMNIVENEIEPFYG